MGPSRSSASRSRWASPCAWPCWKRSRAICRTDEADDGDRKKKFRGEETVDMRRPLHILVAGPYRSGTGDDPAKIEANVDAMMDVALKLFRAGHLPVLGEWYALPLIAYAGSRRIGDAVFDEIF